jgi:hypothetical protein
MQFAKAFVYCVCFISNTIVCDSCFSQAKDEYEINVKSKITMATEGGDQTIIGDTHFKYYLTREENREQMIFESAELNATINNRQVFDATMNQEKFEDKASGLVFKKGDDNPRAKMLKTFGVPLLEFVVDEHGREMSRKILVDADADLLIEAGEYHHARLFHAPFEPDESKWTAPMLFSIGDGATVKGDVDYELVSQENDQATVKFLGELTGETKRKGLDCKDIKYIVSGTQVFDTNKGKWTSGKMDVKLSFVLSSGKGQVATATGKMNFDFKARE